MATAPGYSLLAKAVSSAVSVVKADRVQGGAATNRVQREVSVSVATRVATMQRPFLVNRFVFVTFLRLEK